MCLAMSTRHAHDKRAKLHRRERPRLRILRT
jgi:hypothetical protein